MNARFAPIALMLATLPGALAAEPWEKVDELPGGIAVELDQDSVFEALDGARLVLRGTFRRPNGGWMMETSVAVDCGLEQAKIRGIALMDGDEVLTTSSDPLAEFAPINAGSSESMYYKALCGHQAAVDEAIPEARPEDEGADMPPGFEEAFGSEAPDLTSDNAGFVDDTVEGVETGE